MADKAKRKRGFGTNRQIAKKADFREHSAGNARPVLSLNGHKKAGRGTPGVGQILLIGSSDAATSHAALDGDVPNRHRRRFSARAAFALRR